jgi:hypothetical protein
MNRRGGDNIRARLFKYLGIVKTPPEVNQNTQNLAQVASMHPYRAIDVSEIVPAPPENARKQTPYPYQSILSEGDSAKSNSMSCSRVFIAEIALGTRVNENNDDEKSNSRSESPSGDISLAEIALAMELDEKKDSDVSVQKFFIPKNLGQER